MHRLQQRFRQFQCSDRRYVAITRRNRLGTIQSLCASQEKQNAQNVLYQKTSYRCGREREKKKNKKHETCGSKLTYVNNSSVLAAGKIFFAERFRLLPFDVVVVVITELVPLPFVIIFSLFVRPIGTDVSLGALLLLFIATVTTAVDAVSE